MQQLDIDSKCVEHEGTKKNIKDIQAKKPIRKTDL